MDKSYGSIAKRIDHALLSPTLTDAELDAGCRLAARYGVASVCIKPHAVSLAAELLRGTGVEVGTTIGFPHGGQATEVKLFEAQRAILSGATELDMVVNIGQVRSSHWDAVQAEIAAITNHAHSSGAIIKVIFENCYLDREHIARLCEICYEVHADYVKTSTGFGTGGATIEDLELMKRSIPDSVKLKAAGGIRDLDTLLRMVELGCDRVGLSLTSVILNELACRLGLDPMRAQEAILGVDGFSDSY